MWMEEWGSSDVSANWSVLRVEPFCIDRTEVTCAEYAACLDAGKCKAVTPNGVNRRAAYPAERPDTMHCDRVCAGTSRGDHPMVCVNFHDAEGFCAFRGGHLPIEPEWYLAASGAGGYISDLANEPKTGALSIGMQHPDTAIVGTHPDDTSKFGVRDMLGNVEEWVSSRSGLVRVVDSPRVPSPSAPALGHLGSPEEKRIVEHLFRNNFFFGLETRENYRGFRCAYSAGTRVHIVRKDPGDDDSE
jgi:formylglycine-generating enzyme required for sulfatase activity